jgi:hypothetical protein
LLVYDAADGRARRVADLLRPVLPTGMPVIASADLPEAGTLSLPADEVTGTVVWVDVDGSQHRGRRGLSRALIASGGAHAWWGAAIRVPLVGLVAAVLWQAATPRAAT